MTYLNGGYSIIKKGDANIYASLEKALTNGKPILFYEDENTCYYIDTISKSGDNIILTKGGKTITITDANVVTEIGAIDGYKKYQFNIKTANNTYIVDALLYNVPYPLNTNINIDADLLNYLYDNNIVYRSIAYGEVDDKLYTIADVADEATYKLSIYNNSGTSSEEAIISVTINKN